MTPPRTTQGQAVGRTSSNAGHTGELSILETIRRRAASPGAGRKVVRLGIGDDCALLAPAAGDELAVTTDLSIEGRHFRLDWHPPESVGHRTLARGLSDLASMGAVPAAAFLSLGLPKKLTRAGRAAAKSWLDRYLDGFFALAKAHRVPLAGGDLAEAPITLADILLIGSVPRQQALLRSAARPGDLIYVTGSLGGSAAEFAALSQSPRRFSRQIEAPPGAAAPAPHLYPQPRLAQGIWLREHGATAAIDLSDGISTDLAHLCQESRVTATLDAALIPLGPSATLQQALHGGEDYELLFTAPATLKLPRRIAGVPITQIGTIHPRKRRNPTQPQVSLLESNIERPLQPHGWQHFSAK